LATNTFTQRADGELSIRFVATEGKIAVLSFIAVEKTGDVIPITAHTVTFDPANGDDEFEIEIETNTPIAKPADPIRTNFAFIGWFLDNATEAFDFNTPIIGDITLTAGWILYGDVNNDGRVNLQDANIIVRHFSGWEGYEEINTIVADVNLDGNVNLQDANIVMRHFSGWDGYEILPRPSVAPQRMSVRGFNAFSGNVPRIHASNETGKVGDIVEVQISLENNPGITDVQFLVSYNESELRLVGVIDGGNLGNQTHTPNLSLYPYRLTWWNGGAQILKNYDSDGVIATLRFEVLTEVDNSPITITYSPTNIRNKNDDVINFGVVNGSIGSYTPTLVDNPINEAVLSAFPNPVVRGNALYIEGVAAGNFIEVYNMSGMRIYRTVATNSPARLILDIPAGMYMIRTNNGEVKIVIEN
jgi:uncharacterized repeat protein (TIGR02543 family)